MGRKMHFQPSCCVAKLLLFAHSGRVFFNSFNEMGAMRGSPEMRDGEASSSQRDWAAFCHGAFRPCHTLTQGQQAEW